MTTPIIFPKRNIILCALTHWSRVTHICVSKLTIIDSDNGLSPDWRQAIIWTNDGLLLIPTLGTNFSEIRGEIHSFSFSKMHLKMSSAKWGLFGLGINELNWVLQRWDCMISFRNFKLCSHTTVHFAGVPHILLGTHCHGILLATREALPRQTCHPIGPIHVFCVGIPNVYVFLLSRIVAH